MNFDPVTGRPRRETCWWCGGLLNKPMLPLVSCNFEVCRRCLRNPVRTVRRRKTTMLRNSEDRKREERPAEWVDITLGPGAKVEVTELPPWTPMRCVNRQCGDLDEGQPWRGPLGKAMHDAAGPRCPRCLRIVVRQDGKV